MNSDNMMTEQAPKQRKQKNSRLVANSPSPIPTTIALSNELPTDDMPVVEVSIQTQEITMTSVRMETDEERELREEAEELERLQARQAVLAEKKRIREEAEALEKDRGKKLEAIANLVEEVDRTYTENTIQIEEAMNAFRKQQAEDLASYIENQRLDLIREGNRQLDRYRINRPEFDAIKNSIAVEAPMNILVGLEDRLRDLLPRRTLQPSKTPRSKDIETSSNHSDEKPKGRQGCKKVEYDVNKVRMTDTLILKQSGFPTWIGRPIGVAGKHLKIELVESTGRTAPSFVYKEKGYDRSDKSSIIGASYVSHSAFLRGFEAQHKDDAKKVGSMSYKYITLVRGDKEYPYHQIIQQI